RRWHRRWATCALHVALVCILAGAVTTYYHGKMGTCTLSGRKATFGYITPTKWWRISISSDLRQCAGGLSC
ncbi:MAG: hypothetical protein IIW46_02720, partial [Bacteroidaceae bacterium]|nr:hypothetical protein [Bacteroidaceae bacterium]